MFLGGKVGRQTCNPAVPGSNPPYATCHWMDLSSVAPNSTSPRFVNSQLVCLLLVQFWTLSLVTQRRVERVQGHLSAHACDKPITGELYNKKSRLCQSSPPICLRTKQRYSLFSPNSNQYMERNARRCCWINREDAINKFGDSLSKYSSKFYDRHTWRSGSYFGAWCRWLYFHANANTNKKLKFQLTL